MESVWSRAAVEWIEVGRLTANPWNPNRMAADKRGKLRREIESRGFAAPVAVRALGDGFQIVDGEHRWRIALELGLAQVPAVVLDLDERAARIKTLQLNGLRGDNEPELLAALIAELAQDMELDELEQLLPWTAEEMGQIIFLKDRRQIDAEAKAANFKVKEPARELYAVVVTSEQKEVIDRAVARAREDEKINDNGAALAAVCRGYVGKADDGPKPD